MTRLLRCLLGHESIDGCGDAAYLDRYRLLRLPGGRAVYLHHFIGSDWSRDPHDHPKRFLSIGLRGGYVEERTLFVATRLAGIRAIRLRKQHRAPWVRRFGPLHIHRLRVPRRGCWTLVCTGAQQREWGFWRGDGRWTHWRAYIAARCG